MSDFAGHDFFWDPLIVSREALLYVVFISFGDFEMFI